MQAHRNRITLHKDPIATTTTAGTAVKQYRNGTYVGGAQGEQPHGLGVLLMDDTELVLGDWQDGGLQGEYVYLGQRVRAMGRISPQGQLEGFQVIKCMRPWKQPAEGRGRVFGRKHPPLMTLYAVFKSDRIFGKCVVVHSSCIFVCSPGSDEAPLHVLKTVDHSNIVLREMLRSTFPYISKFDLREHLESIIEKANSNGPMPGRYRPCVRNYPHGFEQKNKNLLNRAITGQQHRQQPGLGTTFYGFSTPLIKNSAHEFGFILDGEQLISAGWHHNGTLQGLGLLFCLPTDVQHGIFHQGRLAQGVRWECGEHRNRYIHGKFQDGHLAKENAKIWAEGPGWPEDIVREFWSREHLKSVYFDPGYAEIGLRIDHDYLECVASSLKSEQTPNLQPKNNGNIRNLSQIQSFAPRQPATHTNQSPEAKASPKIVNPKIFSASRIPIPTPRRPSLAHAAEYESQRSHRSSDRQVTQEYQSLYFNYRSKQRQQAEQKEAIEQPEKVLEHTPARNRLVRDIVSTPSARGEHYQAFRSSFGNSFGNSSNKYRLQSDAYTGEEQKDSKNRVKTVSDFESWRPSKHDK